MKITYDTWDVRGARLASRTIAQRDKEKMAVGWRYDVAARRVGGLGAKNNAALASGFAVASVLAAWRRTAAPFAAACACLKKYTAGREKRRAAIPSCVTSSPPVCVNIQARRRQGRSIYSRWPP